MSFLLIYEDSEDVLHFDVRPSPDQYPSYTYGYDTSNSRWYRVHTDARLRNGWYSIDPNDPEDGPVPKSIRAAVLLLGG